MAERRDDPTLYWVSPESAASFPWTVSMSRAGWRARCGAGVSASPADRAFRAVMQACAAPAPGREETWINDEILRLYTARCMPAATPIRWNAGRSDELVGGLYGVRAGRRHFSAKACSAAYATPARWRWCIWWRACAGAASSCWIPSFSPASGDASAPYEIPAQRLSRAAAPGDLRQTRCVAGSRQSQQTSDLAPCFFRQRLECLPCRRSPAHATLIGAAGCHRRHRRLGAPLEQLITQTS